MDFIMDSLTLLGEPASLFEWPDLRFVAANAPASPEGEVLDYGADYCLSDWGVDVDKAKRSIEKKDYFATEDKGGHKFLTLLRSDWQWARPDLLLATSHNTQDRETAYLQHYRMVSMMQTNEAGYRALSQMESAVAQLQAAVSAQREMLKTTNHRAAETFRLLSNIPIDRS